MYMSCPLDRFFGLNLYVWSSARGSKPRHLRPFFFFLTLSYTRWVAGEEGSLQLPRQPIHEEGVARVRLGGRRSSWRPPIWILGSWQLNMGPGSSVVAQAQN